MSGLCRFHSSPLYELEDRLAILPLLLIVADMLEADDDPVQGPSHRLFGVRVD